MAILGIEVDRGGVSVSNPLDKDDAFRVGIGSIWEKTTTGNPIENWTSTPGQWWDDSRNKIETEYERIGGQIQDEYDRFEDKVKGFFEEWGSGVEDDTNRLASLNADAIQAESDENVRRQKLQYADLRNQVIGIQASSGFLSSTGTNVDYIQKMDTSFQKEIDYINKSTESQISITLLEGEIQGKIAKNNERANNVNTATGVLGIFK